MVNSDYPQRLLLHKIEEDENLDGQTHYFKICDEGGTVITDTDWYPSNQHLLRDLRTIK